MKRAAVIFTVFVMVTLNLKVLAHAVTAPPAKTRFVLFCMTSKGSQASCSHKNCPLHDNSKHDTSKEDNLIYCETRIECGAAHNNETTVLSANDAIYIHSTQTITSQKSA